MKRNEQPRAEQILTETDATRSTPGFRNIISEFARVNDSIVIEPSEDDSVGFQETDNPNFPDRPAYRLSLPSTLTVAHVIEAITHIESVSDKLPVTITSIQTARMMIASGDYIREHVLPITKDPQGFSEIADSMEEYGEKMKAETPKEFQAEFEKPPSDEEMFTWLLGKEAYTRLYSSYHRIHKIDPNNAMHHDEFTDYLQRRFGEILTQYPSERTTHGLEQAALSREKDVMSALHKRGKRELVTKLFARTSKERRDDYTKKYGLGFPLYRAEQQELTESIKQRVGFDDAMTELTLLREQKEKENV